MERIRHWLRTIGQYALVILTFPKLIIGLRRDFDKLAQLTTQLARQGNLAAQATMENRRRLKHHESGPLAPSRVILDKRDGEKARKLSEVTSIIGSVTPRDITPSIPITEDRVS